MNGSQASDGNGPGILSSFLQAKWTIRNVSFNGPDDFFEKTMLNYAEKTCDQWLGPLVPNLPAFPTVIGELGPFITSLPSMAVYASFNKFPFSQWGLRSWIRKGISHWS